MDEQHMQPKMPEDWPEVRWLLQRRTVHFTHVVVRNFAGGFILFANCKTCLVQSVIYIYMLRQNVR